MTRWQAVTCPSGASTPSTPAPQAVNLDTRDPSVPLNYAVFLAGLGKVAGLVLLVVPLVVLLVVLLVMVLLELLELVLVEVLVKVLVTHTSSKVRLPPPRRAA